ncbi:type II toxin-antitoxin system RelE/ParE family toxin [Candidatus Woesebacteria bacterium]|nr:type II toxin-antitoxin system RelE/ParE family toxin [Candidatus Woesebacteria bacterium]
MKYNHMYSRNARRDLLRLASDIDRKKVIKKTEKLTLPFPNELHIKHIRGSITYYRLRVGRMRVLFEVLKKKKEIWILKIGYRQNFYRIH